MKYKIYFNIYNYFITQKDRLVVLLSLWLLKLYLNLNLLKSFQLTVGFKWYNINTDKYT